MFVYVVFIIMCCVFRSFDCRSISSSISNFYEFIDKKLVLDGNYYVYITCYDCKSKYSFRDASLYIDLAAFYLGDDGVNGANFLIDEIGDLRKKLIDSLVRKGCKYGDDCEECVDLFNVFNLYFIRVPHGNFMDKTIINSFISKILLRIIMLWERYYYK